MRKLANFTDRQTGQLLMEVLYARDINSDLRKNNEGSYTLWVHSEDQLEEAQSIFQSFRENPDKPEFQSMADKALRIRKKRMAEEKHSRYKTVDVRVNWRTSSTRGPVTITLMIICIGIALITEFGERVDIIRYLTIADFATAGNFVRHFGFADILSGQLWRLLTPSLIHFGGLHLLFNLWWLYDLGNAIENKKGPLFLILLFVAISIVANAAQFMVTSSPLFGGMSGVVYGLLGYIWMLGKFKPHSGLFVPKPVITIMLVWLALGFTGFFGVFGVGIANIVHLFGLIVGTLWGYLESGDWKRHLRQR